MNPSKFMFEFTPEALRRLALEEIASTAEPDQRVITGLSTDGDDLLVEHDRLTDKVHIYVNEGSEGVVLTPDNHACFFPDREIVTTDDISDYRRLLAATAFQSGVAGL